jgi:hypothetical protein
MLDRLPALQSSEHLIVIRVNRVVPAHLDRHRSLGLNHPRLYLPTIPRQSRTPQRLRNPRKLRTRNPPNPNPRNHHPPRFKQVHTRSRHPTKTFSTPSPIPKQHLSLPSSTPRPHSISQKRPKQDHGIIQ